MGKNVLTNKEKLEQVKALIGESAFLKLAEHYAGRRIYFPKKKRPKGSQNNA